MRLRRVVSGGQTGVDRAALDAALAAGLEVGGWCPRGRRAEDGPIPARYPLRETGASTYPPRTRRNVREADATLILVRGPTVGGTALTLRTAEELERPLRVVDLAARPVPADTAAWIEALGAATLNVAGPRESQQPGIYGEASAFLAAVFSRARAGA